MPELYILGSAIVSVFSYWIISVSERSYFNFFTPTMLIFIPTAYLLELYYIYYFGYSNSFYAYFWCYFIYGFKNILFAMAYAYFKSKFNIANNTMYKYKISYSPYIFMLIAIFMYLPILVEFSDLIFSPRQIYMQTRIGYGLSFILSTSFYYFGYILLLFKEEKFNIKVYLFFLIGMVFIYFHASKYQYLVLISISLMYKIYVINDKFSFIKATKFVFLVGAGLLSAFYFNYSDYREVVDGNDLMINISKYSDYNRNNMMVIDSFDDITYGKISAENFIYSKIPRQLFPEKPKEFGSRHLVKYYYSDWFDSEAGDPIFGDGVQYADFKEFSIIYYIIVIIFEAFMTAYFLSKLKSKYSILSFVMVMFFSGMPLIIAGNGYFLFEILIIAYVLNRIALLQLKF